jgi:hypothetical protein
MLSLMRGNKALTGYGLLGTTMQAAMGSWVSLCRQLWVVGYDYAGSYGLFGMTMQLWVVGYDDAAMGCWV